MLPDTFLFRELNFFSFMLY